MKELYIIGAGSVGGHVASNLNLYNLEYDSVYFIDDNTKKLNNYFCGCQVIGDLNFLNSLGKNVHVILGVAFPRMKKNIVERLNSNKKIEFLTIIANNSWVSSDVILGSGCIIYPNSSINYGTNIGDFVTINMNCSIGHHAIIDNFVSLAPGVKLGGHTEIGFCADIGIGASTLQGITIGENAIVGGQSLVNKNLERDVKVVGVPARKI
jgi:sugar O-acyltransferase (sialic acid O-acetyltransferase NeuD family)